MKNLFIAHSDYVGLSNQGFSQISGEGKEVKLENVTISPDNITYLTNVLGTHTPRFSETLETKAARYNVKDSPMF